MQREVKSLDGRWQIAFDPGNVGKLKQWTQWDRFVADAPREYIDVPACWERFRQDYEGVAWYGHTFTVPADWEGRSVRIHFGAVNYLTEVYLNNEPVGYHEGGYTDFAFELGDMLRFGEDADPNTLLLRVIGPIVTQDIVIDGIGRDDMPHWRGAIAGGVWQSVELTASQRVYLSDVFADPDLAGSCVRVQAAVENLDLKKRDLRARLRAVPLGVVGRAEHVADTAAGEAAVELTALPGRAEFTAVVPIESPRPWSPASPFLYRLHVELYDAGSNVDECSVRFGMRELRIDDKGYWLNGRRVLVKSAFFEGLYPTTLAAPPDDAFARRELQLAKDAGFNLLRPWRKPQPPIVYDLADEMGIMFVGTMPIECMDRWPTMTPYAERRMRNEVRESVRRDRNHACIVIWEIFNEITRPSLQRIKHRISREARTQDPSRYILDESGGFGGGAFYYPPNSTEPFQVNDVHSYPGAPFDQEGYDKLLSLGKTEEQLAALGRTLPVNRQPGGSKQIAGGFVHVSEIGYGSLPDLEANAEQYRREGNPLTPEYRYHLALLEHFRRALALTGLDGIFPTVREFCEATQDIHAVANKLMLEAIRINPDIDGFTIHAYTDGDWVVGAGLLDIFRNPKKPYYAARETNQPVYLALRTSKRNAYAGDDVVLTATVASEREEAWTACLELEVCAADGRVVESAAREARISCGVTRLFSESLPTDGLAGLHTLRGRLTRDGELVTENSYGFRVVPRPDIPAVSARVAIVDPWGKLSGAMEVLGISHMPFDADTPVGRLVLADARALHWNKGERDEASALLPEFIRAGGTVLYLDIPPGTPVGVWAGDQVLAAEWLPVQLLLRPTRGLWSPFSHVIRRHPVVSRNLPADKIMDQDYVNVFPHTSILNVADVDPRVPLTGMDLWSQLGVAAPRAPICTLGLGWRPGAFTDDRDYRGPGPVVYGADLIDWPCGAGKIVLSTLRLINSIGSDPVADILLANVVSWAGTLHG